jgi:hypothetical protein
MPDRRLERAVIDEVPENSAVLQPAPPLRAMGTVALAQRLGRRADHLLRDQSLFAWTHRVLGMVAGSVCVLSAILTGHLQLHRISYWSQRAFSFRAALVFFAAAIPFVVSYTANRDFVDERTMRTFLFAATLVTIATVADTGTVLIFWSSTTLWALVAVYAAQAIAYVVLGRAILEHDPDRDDSDR